MPPTEIVIGNGKRLFHYRRELVLQQVNTDVWLLIKLYPLKNFLSHIHDMQFYTYFDSYRLGFVLHLLDFCF